MGKLSVLIAGGGGTVELLLRDQAISGLIDQVIIIEREPGGSLHSRNLAIS